MQQRPIRMRVESRSHRAFHPLATHSIPLLLLSWVTPLPMCAQADAKLTFVDSTTVVLKSPSLEIWSRAGYIVGGQYISTPRIEAYIPPAHDARDPKGRVTKLSLSDLMRVSWIPEPVGRSDSTGWAQVTMRDGKTTLMLLRVQGTALEPCMLRITGQALIGGLQREVVFEEKPPFYSGRKCTAHSLLTLDIAHLEKPPKPPQPRSRDRDPRPSLRVRFTQPSGRAITADSATIYTCSTKGWVNACSFSVADGVTLTDTVPLPPGLHMRGRFIRWSDIQGISWGARAEGSRPAGVDTVVLRSGAMELGYLWTSDDWPVRLAPCLIQVHSPTINYTIWLSGTTDISESRCYDVRALELQQVPSTAQ